MGDVYMYACGVCVCAHVHMVCVCVCVSVVCMCGVCVYACVHVCSVCVVYVWYSHVVWVCVCVCVYLCVGQRLVLGVLLDLPLNLELSQLATQASQQTPEILLFPSPEC